MSFLCNFKKYYKIFISRNNMVHNYFEFDDIPKKSSTHLAINKYCGDLISSGKAHTITRFYYHDNAVILANAQSTEDIYVDQANSMGFEIIRRPTGGSVIVATPGDMLCYSIFLPISIFDEKRVSNYYKSFTLPLAQKLGDDFEIAGAYYLRYKGEPIAGHALDVKKEYVQIDGLIHTKKPDVSLLSKLIKMRKLYSSAQGDVIEMDGKFYKGSNEIDFSREEYTPTLDEVQILSGFQGLDATSYSPEEYSHKIKETLESILGSVEWKTVLPHDSQIVAKYQQEILKDTFSKGFQKAQGHCFVDFSEPEPRIHSIDDMYS